MRTTTLSVLTIPLLLSALTSALTLDCSHIRVDKKKFNFEKLSGPHSVTIVDKDRPPSIHNITYSIDICQPLRPDSKIPKAERCPQGTNICGIESTYNPVDGERIGIESVIPIAGNFETSTGKGLEPKYSRLKSADTAEEGLLMELHGGKYNKKDQMAIIEFQCDLTRTGNEDLTDEAEEEKRKTKKDVGAYADKDTDEGKDPKERSLQYVSYGSRDEETDLLRLLWKTKYACEDYEDDDGDDNGSSGKSSHWGFFTWFIIILFLGVAAYLIFGSWLNYNRYGARGWDLLPHGDTIRDIPYLFKDWSRKVVDTVQGNGTRGGYSAV